MSTPPRILILEDSVSDTELMVYELRSSGIQVDWQRVETEADFLAQLDAGWDVILADYRMPQFEAMRALRVLQERGLDVPLIIVTGSISEEVAVECIKQGAADYLLKDRLVRLGQSVTQAVQQKRLRDEKRQTEQALRESEERFRDFFEKDLAANSVSTPDGRLITCNRSFLRMFGFRSMAEALACDLNLLFRSKAERDALVNLVRKRRRLVAHEMHMRRIDGTPLNVVTNAVGIFDDAGELVEMLGNGFDITEQKQAEKRYRAIFEKDLAANSITTPDGHLLACNPSFRRMFGFRSLAEALGCDMVLLHPSKAERDAVIDLIRQGRTLVDHELHMRRIDGTPLNVVINSVGIFDNADQLIEIHGHAFDITARKQAEIQLQQQVECDRLLAAIALKIGQSLNLDDILNTTVAEVRQFLQADRVIVYNFDVNQHGLPIAQSLAPDWIHPQINSHRTWLQSARAEFQQGYVQIINDINQTDVTPASLELMTRLKIKAKLAIPILQGNYLWGLLSVHQCSQARQWRSTEIALLEQLATQVAIAIQQVQLFNQVQQQALREQLLNHISQAVNSSLDPERILQEIVNLIGDRFGVDRVTIYSIDTEHIRVLKEWRKSEEIVSVLDWQAPISEHLDLLDPHSDCSFQRPFHTFNYAEIDLTPIRRTRIERAQVISGVRVPIWIRDRLFGGLSLQTTTAERTFTTEEVHLLERIANQAAIALYNAQSYERLEQLVKERTAELEQEKLISETADLAKTEFLSNMSHELRTPLTGILGFSKMLLKQIFGPLNEKQQQYVTGIVSSGEHLLALINDLLDLSKIEAGKEELFLEILAVENVCQQCISLIERFNNRGLELILEIDPNVETCIADERRLKQILFNLLSNAVKFTEAGSVTLNVSQTPNTIYFAVIDTGIGIALSDQPNLFEAFRQLDSGLNRKYEGTGLGLALTRKLARLHGGDVTVTSELGRGSRFILHLAQRPPGWDGGSAQFG